MSVLDELKGDMDRAHLVNPAERQRFSIEWLCARIERLEALAKPLRVVMAPKNISEAELARLVDSVKELGATVLPYGCMVPAVELEPPVGVYAGDGHPRARYAAAGEDPE